MELWAKVMSLERVAGPKNTDSASRDVVEKHDEGIVLGKDKREGPNDVAELICRLCIYTQK